MTGGKTSPYESLPNATSTRVLLLAPGHLDDDIFGWLVTVGLDKDHALFPDTTPRPMDIPMEYTASTPDGEERKFAVPIDIYLDDSINIEGMIACPTHPFQRYTALSYVWGNATDPEYIILNGNHRFPVTRNFVAFWIDAICMNQTDYEEKKTQIALMRRICQQAQEVIAYVPICREDQDRISELVPKIWAAGEAYEEQSKESGASTIIAKEHGDSGSKSLTSVPQLEVKKVTLDTEQGGEPKALLHEYLKENPNGLFLEDFGLPQPDSPLWGAWRRLFASPYFRRVWILQEFALAKKLTLCLGAGTADAMGLLQARPLIQQHSGNKNAQYLGHSQPGNPDNLTQDAIAGAQGADRMFFERVVNQSGLGDGRDRLIDQLNAARTFDATDPRDKVYALLGLARDADFFTSHVDYAPEETPAKTYAKFARLFVEKGEGLALLLQAGLGNLAGKVAEDLPSWVPNWAQNRYLPHPDTPSQTLVSQPHMRITEDGKTLIVQGTIVDQTEQVSHVAFRHNNTGEQEAEDNEEKAAPSNYGLTVSDFLYAFSSGISMILESSKSESQDSFDDVLETIFNVVSQPGSTKLSKRITNKIEATDGFDDAGKEHEEVESLRLGFHNFWSYCLTMAREMKDLKEGEAQVILLQNPDEWQKFLDRATRNTSHRRFCVARSGRIGLVPDATEVGDRVAIFGGSDIAFVLRPAGQDGLEDSSTSAKSNEREGRKEIYKLVGHAYFYDNGEQGRKGQSQDISLV
ncbi:het domain-containing protein [Seiridium cupressi]